jgi:hypothetical protein
MYFSNGATLARSFTHEARPSSLCFLRGLVVQNGRRKARRTMAKRDHDANAGWRVMGGDRPAFPSDVKRCVR